ncbi:hypothetical protein [Brachyspira hyodysenteriae]|uniref:hypothetical protein n=2 Tax=Brachyspira hyodysenteriae TaxID=159 RepID=UPI0022CD99D4|nr:hypothetical protein [Brachyspira hyodysenteriae]MCZ9955202.1 hypothetical protein [Brachyspira hyodysenteriae]
MCNNINNIIKENIFDTVDVIKNDMVFLYIIKDLSDKLKSYIRENLDLYVGNNKNEYISVLKQFKEIIDSKDDIKKMGIIGELLSHIFIKCNSNNFKTISVLFNLEDKSYTKAFDIVITDSKENTLWFAEVKSGQVNENETSQSKNTTLLQKSKREFIDKINNQEKYIWANTINHAEKIIKDENSKILDILNKIYDEKIKIDYYRNAVLFSVVFNNIDDTIIFEKILEERKKYLTQICLII